MFSNIFVLANRRLRMCEPASRFEMIAMILLILSISIILLISQKYFTRRLKKNRLVCVVLPLIFNWVYSIIVLFAKASAKFKRDNHANKYLMIL